MNWKLFTTLYTLTSPGRRTKFPTTLPLRELQSSHCRNRDLNISRTCSQNWRWPDPPGSLVWEASAGRPYLPHRQTIFALQSLRHLQEGSEGHGHWHQLLGSHSHRVNSMEADSAERPFPVQSHLPNRMKQRDRGWRPEGRETKQRTTPAPSVGETVTPEVAWQVTPNAVLVLVLEPELWPRARIHSLLRLADAHCYY